MALVNLASSQVFLPTEVVTSRADREGASRLDLLRVKIKGLRVRECLSATGPHRPHT